MIQVSALYTYPLKSARGLAWSAVNVTPRGLLHDRRWMLVDAQGKFISARKHPRLLLLDARFDGDCLQLAWIDAVGREQHFSIETPTTSATLSAVELWKQPVAVCRLEHPVNAALSAWLGTVVHLVFQPEHAIRTADPQFAQAHDPVSLADGFPLLILSQASLETLNARLQTPVRIENFRPNLVLQGCEAHAEDTWRRVRIGDCEFELVKPCSRCILTTMDPATGFARSDGEPLRSLQAYRRHALGVVFGMNAIPRRLGTLQVGDSLSVIE